MPVLDVGPRGAARTPVGFDQRPYERFTLAPLSPTIGAEVGGVDLAVPLDVELRSELRRALLEWKVLFFRDQVLTRDEHRVFALQWGIGLVIDLGRAAGLDVVSAYRLAFALLMGCCALSYLWFLWRDDRVAAPATARSA